MLSRCLHSMAHNFKENPRFSNNLLPLSSAGPIKHWQSREFRKVPPTYSKEADVPSWPKESSCDPMFPPSLYRSGNSYQLTEGIKLLKQVENGFKKTGSQRQRYLDIGCGTGNLTREILLSHGGDSSDVVGADISPAMIDYARQHSPHPCLSYDVLDIEIGNASSFVDKHGKFDRVYSFFCLNWVRDKRRAFRNIGMLLRDDGQFLLVFTVRTDLRKVFIDIANLQRWREYTVRWEAFIASHQDYGSSDAAMKYTRTALHEAFMMPQTCQVYTSHVDFKTKQSLMGTLSQKCDQNF